MGVIAEIAEQLRGLTPRGGELRKQGLVLGAVLALLGCWLWFSGAPAWGPWLLALGLLLITVAVARPALLTPVLRLWMALAFLLGQIVSRILLTGVYYGLITPLGLAMRLAGKDLLDRKLGDRQSYWHETDVASHDPRNSERMF